VLLHPRLNWGLWRERRRKRGSSFGRLDLWYVAKMSRSMTACAERNEVLFSIVSQPAARAEVVDLKILCCAAVLAAPSIAREHLAGKLAVSFGFKP
jgi:hypothetical protein